MAGTRAVMLKSLVDGDTFLTSDGAEVDLAGVLAPGSGGEYASKTKANAAREELAQALANGALSLGFAGAEKDRHGRLPAQVFANNEWVQGMLLRGGLARANPETAAACAQELLAAEAEARDTKRGHWGDSSFVVYGPDSLAHKEGTFQIVEGTVQTVAVQRARVYLNFGADWHSDFTVTIAPEDMKLFRHEKVNVKAFQGKRVRVRGWVEFYHGLEIEVGQSVAIEVLDEAAAPTPKNEKPGR